MCMEDYLVAYIVMYDDLIVHIFSQSFSVCYIIWWVIFVGTNFRKQAKIQVSEIFAVLIFTFGESGTCTLRLKAK